MRQSLRQLNQKRRAHDHKLWEHDCNPVQKLNGDLCRRGNNGRELRGQPFRKVLNCFDSGFHNFRHPLHHALQELSQKGRAGGPKAGIISGEHLNKGRHHSGQCIRKGGAVVDKPLHESIQQGSGCLHELRGLFCKDCYTVRENVAQFLNQALESALIEGFVQAVHAVRPEGYEVPKGGGQLIRNADFQAFKRRLENGYIACEVVQLDIGHLLGRSLRVEDGFAYRVPVLPDRIQKGLHSGGVPRVEQIADRFQFFLLCKVS